jgi:ADP-heptose:LPS heptosyltransferase
MNTLIILPHNLGDVIMTTPLLEGLKEARRSSRVFFLVEDGFEAGLINSPHVDDLIRFPRRAIRDLLFFSPWPDGAARLRGAIEDISARGIDLLINLGQSRYLSYIASLIKAEKKLGQSFVPEGAHGVADAWSQYLYAIPFGRRFNNLHAADVYRRIGGAKQHRGGYTVSLAESEKAAAREFLAARGIAGDAKIVLFQPGAAYPSKCWPVEHFSALGAMLLQDGWSIVISGAPAEADRMQGIHAALDNACIETSGTLSFRESIALVSCARACVTGDTAMMHAAAAFDVPVYALFGPTNPVETGPYGDGHRIFSSACNRRPCFCFECESMLCMKSILPRTVHACMRGEKPADPRCDLFRTVLRHDGDYRLECVTGNNPYVDEAGALMIRRGFSEPADLPAGLSADIAAHAVESRAVLSVIAEMKTLLNRFLGSRDVHAVKTFETKKGDLAGFAGIGAFWAALLNIRLNSIPVLDPVKAVRESLRACIETEDQLRNSLKGIQSPAGL